MRILISGLIVLLIIATSYVGYSQNNPGQKGIIRGSIEDEAGSPLPGITLWLSGTSKGTASDAEGRFEIKGIAAGSYQLLISGVGYEEKKLSVSIEPKTALELQLRLSDKTQLMDELVITSKSEAVVISQTPFAVNSIDTQPLNTQSLDVNQVLNRTTGIRIREEGGLGSRFNFSLNGLSGRQVKFFIDGIPMDYMGDAFSMNNIPVNLVDRVDVYKGVVPVKLGSDALGGAVNIVTNQKVNSYVDASYSLGSFNTHRAAVSGRYRDKKSGLTTKVLGFYNYSDNNYRMQDIEVFVEGEEQEMDVERFHDAYQSTMGQVEIGFTGKKWADILMVGAAYAGFNNEIQSSIFGKPVGEPTVEEDNQLVSARYQKNNLFAPGFNVELYTQFNMMNSVSIDTSSNRYNWLGQIIRTENNSLGELVREKTIFEYDQSFSLQRANVSYTINPKHHFSLNYIRLRVSREGENRINKDEDEPFSNPNALGKHVTGLAYESNLFNDQLTTIFSAKHYYFDMLTRNAREFVQGEVRIEDISTEQHNLGFSFSGRYFLSPKWYTKFSFEKGYRLPEAKEILGDGLRILASPLLKPESTYNANLGVNFQQEFENSSFQAETNVFWRDVDNFIFIQQQGVFSAYQNLVNVLSRGAELDLRLTLNNSLDLNANFTWQDVLNNEKYVQGTKVESRVYRDRMPNRPYFFANADIQYQLVKDSKRLNVSAYYSINYVHEFYLSYASTSINSTKNIIPAQLINNTGITFNTPERKYSLSLEVRNLYNAVAYDNFKMQKPGRAFYMKLRYFLNEKF
ncbi:TonB-dependent receptor [Porifericola rhodea]|uniref:TonB-dependent receptor n=1 Tax=Porifericola rhodea TaxID=930972 RepID=UPI002665263B|nr:TonB-dependent receptor [Porifericola rhodea]WKN30300.1 TonB-dependent receptor [Porifericola rhodea]